MKCSKPVWVQDKATGGTMMVPCGRCLSCRLNKARMWSLRIMHETRSWDSSIFVTLTYDDAHLPKNGSLVKSDVQDFFKRLRKRLDRPMKYFLGGEYGDIGSRPHYHSVIFGLSVMDEQAINSAWGLGYIHIGNVTFDSARYVASYTIKKLSGDRALEYARRGVIPEFALMSRRPGIGARYCERNEKFLRDNMFCVAKGSKVGLPRYYRDRLFSDEEKAIFHQMMEEVNAERFENTRKMARVTEGFEVLDYQRSQRGQLQRDMEARQGLKRRKL